MNDKPRELYGVEVLRHAAALLRATEAKEPIQWWDGSKWCDIDDPGFCDSLKCYRVAPKPMWGNVYPIGSIGGTYASREKADKAAGRTGRNRIACVKFYPGQFDD